GEEIDAIFRQLKQSLIEKLLDQVLTADVDDEGNLRFKRCEVREILFGTDAEINTPRSAPALEVRNHPLILPFVRYEIVGTKVTAGLRKILDHLPEGVVADFVG